MGLTSVVMVLHVVQISVEISIVILEELIKSFIRATSSVTEMYDIKIIILLFQLFGLHNTFVHATGISFSRNANLPYDPFKAFSLRIWVCLASATCVVHMVKIVFSLSLINEIDDRFTSTLAQGIKWYNMDMHWNVMWNYIQYFYSCCGVNFYKDWENIMWSNINEEQYFLR